MRYSGKGKIYWHKTGFDCNPGSGIHPTRAEDEGFSVCLPVIREVVLAANANKTGERSMVSLMKANYRDVLVETAKLSTEEWTEDPPFQPDIRKAPGTNAANTPV